MTKKKRDEIELDRGELVSSYAKHLSGKSKVTFRTVYLPRAREAIKPQKSFAS